MSTYWPSPDLDDKVYDTGTRYRHIDSMSWREAFLWAVVAVGPSVAAAAVVWR